MVMSKKIAACVASVLLTFFAAAETVNVRNLGATGDGTTDDWVAFSKALSSATNSSSVVTVVVPAGTYAIGQPLVVYSNTRIQLDDKATIVPTDTDKFVFGLLRGQHQSSPGVPCVMGVDCPHGGYSQVTNVTISGGTWNHVTAVGTGDSATGTVITVAGSVTSTNLLSDAYIMHIWHGSNITVENLTCKGNVSHHLNFSGCSNVVVRNVIFKQSDSHPYEVPIEEDKKAGFFGCEALHLDFITPIAEAGAHPVDGTSCRDIYIDNCTFDNMIAGVGTHRHYSDDGDLEVISNLAERIVVKDCIFKSMLSYAVSMYCYDKSQVIGNSVTGTTGSEASGLRLLGSGDVRVEGNTVSGVGAHGISIEALAGEVKVVDVADNIISGVGEHGVYVGGSLANVRVSDNQVSSVGRNGVNLENGAHATVERNTFAKVGGYGLCVLADTALSAVSNVVSSSVGSAFYLLNAAESSLVGNEVSSTDNCGFQIGGAKCNIVGNRLLSTASHGLSAIDGAKITADGNIFENVGEHGLFASGSGTTLSFTNGRLGSTGNEKNGVHAENLAFITVSDTHFEKVGQHGACSLSAATLEVLGGTFTTVGGHGILASGNDSTLTFTNGRIGATGKNGIQAENGSTVTVSGAQFDNVGQHGACGQSSAVLKVSGCVFTAPTAYGVYAIAPKECVLDSNTFTNVGSAVAAIRVESVSSNKLSILKNTIVTPKGRGIYVSDVVGAKIADNIITNNTSGEGLYLKASSNVEVSGNKIEDVKNIGILVDGSSTSIDKLSIYGNKVISYDSRGDIRVSGSHATSVKIYDNLCGGFGVMMDASAIDGVEYCPANATITSVKGTSADTAVVSWMNLAGITDYIVEYSTSADFKNVKVENATDGSGQCVISGLASSDTWYVIVRSHHNYYGTDYYSYSTDDKKYNAEADEKYVKKFSKDGSDDTVYYSVRFDANGGEGTMADQAGFVYGTAKVLTANAFTRAGYVFSGWATSTGSSVVAYADGASLSSPSPKPEIGGIVTLYAVWAVDTTKYTIHFDGNGATSGTMADQRGFTPGKGDVALRANAFVRAGYRFLGWSKNAKATTPYWLDGAVINTSTVAGSTLTIYAIWERDANATYTVAFNANGGSGTMAAQADFVPGVAKALPANKFVRTGWLFTGWSLSATASAATYANGALFASDTASGGTVTLYAVWSPDPTKTYNVHFDGNGATGGEMADQPGFVPGNGGRRLNLNQFTRTGYNFLGWSKFPTAAAPTWTDGATLNTSTAIGATLTLYAVWEPDPDSVYTVAFNANGGIGTMAAVTNFVTGVERALPANKFTQAGYRFLGWALDIDATAATYADGAMFVSDTASGGTVTLYAVWSPDPTKTYNVHFDGNGATGGEMADQPGFVPGNGGRRLNLNQFTRTGYNFLGWSKSSTAAAPTWTDGATLNTTKTAIGATLTLYAVWQYNPGRTYTVAFDANGGTGEMADQIDFVNGEVRELAPNAFVRDGYVFKGWSRSLTASSATYADGAPITNSSPNVAVGHTMTLFAVWEADATCCTAHFDANGGEGEMADQLGFHVGKPHALARNAFVRAGYAFKGWATTPDATAASVADGASYTTTAAAGSTFTLYAVWAVDPECFTVRFDANGGTGEMEDQLGFVPGKRRLALNYNAFVRPGFRFLGWARFPKSAAPLWADGEALAVSAGIAPSGSILTLYAVWEEAPDTYAIDYDANGGEGAMPMQQGVASGVLTALTASAFTREGYAFKGWARSPSTTSVAYADGADVSLPAAAFDDATLKLYAVWEPLANYTVVFNKNDGTAAKTSKTYKPGVRVQLPRATIPSGLDWAREGYAFKGWAYSSGATIAVIDDWTVVQDLAAAGGTVNLYGVWSPLDTVTFDMQGGGGGTTFVNAERDDLLPRIKTLPSRYGFVFQGYFSAPDGAGTRYYNADGTGTQVWDGTGDATLYASWVSDGKFTVVLHKNDGTGVEHVVVVEEGKGVALPGGASDLKWAPRRGFTYMGWSDSEKSKVVKFKDKENMRAYFKAGEVVHVYAIWQLNLATSYAIQYIRNDGSGSVRTIGFVGGVDTKLNSVAALGFARRGYDFGGWATTTTNARNRVVWRPDKGVVSQPVANGKLMQIYAIWTLKAGFYSIRFNKNDGSGKWRELGYEYGKNTTLPTIVNGLGWGRDGYTFVGWATSKAKADAGTIWQGDAGITKTPIAAGRTLSLYAVWRVSAASAVASAPSGASVTSAGNASMVRERTWIEPALEVGETCLHGVLTDGGTYDLIVDANGTTGYARIETATDVVASECAVDAGEEILTARLEDGTVLVIFGDGSAVVE